MPKSEVAVGYSRGISSSVYSFDFGKSVITAKPVRTSDMSYPDGNITFISPLGQGCTYVSYLDSMGKALKFFDYTTMANVENFILP
jgi:hypothetical protein